MRFWQAVAERYETSESQLLRQALRHRTKGILLKTHDSKLKTRELRRTMFKGADFKGAALEGAALAWLALASLRIHLLSQGGPIESENVGRLDLIAAGNA